MSGSQQALEPRVLQIVMTVNKEAVLSEKQLSAHFGQTILVAYSEPLSPEGHDSPESFFAAVQREWDAQWQRAYSAEYAGTL